MLVVITTILICCLLLLLKLLLLLARQKLGLVQVDMGLAKGTTIAGLLLRPAKHR